MEIGERFAAAADALEALNVTWIEERTGVRVGILQFWRQAAGIQPLPPLSGRPAMLFGA